jgi:hypothetical protein
VTAGEFMIWAAGTGRVLAEFGTQLARAKISRNQRQDNRIIGPGPGPGADGGVRVRW